MGSWVCYLEPPSPHFVRNFLGLFGKVPDSQIQELQRHLGTHPALWAVALKQLIDNPRQFEGVLNDARNASGPFAELLGQMLQGWNPNERAVEIFQHLIAEKFVDDSTLPHPDPTHLLHRNLERSWLLPPAMQNPDRPGWHHFRYPIFRTHFKNKESALLPTEKRL
ncbi:MAG: hypothetical protein IPK82_39675 [Polyangiaceae bacterium]|nr:hypothetical protein [Polyangiaceae bacterium]